MTGLIDLQYLPSLEFFTFLLKYDTILVEKEEHFIKQTYRNRCHIVGANKVERLIVPVIGGNKKIKVRDIKIDYSQKWVNVHWRALQSAYGKAPFFEFFSEAYEKVLRKNDKYLFDLNWNILTLCLDLLRMEKNIEFTHSYIPDPNGDITDMRSFIHPKKDFRERDLYHPEPYHQVFGKGFVANMSIIDLLFCEGPNAINILRRSAVAE